jgi:hypothetical protein
MNENEDMSKNINKLLALLKKMLAQDPNQANSKGHIPQDLQNLLKDNKNVQVNLCLFAFLPMHLEDLEDMEGVYEETMSLDMENEPRGKDSLSMEINEHDMEFLRKNGLTF